MKTTTVAALLTTFAAPAFGAINMGVAWYSNGHSDTAMWIDGQQACDYNYLGDHQTQNPCQYNGGWFQATNGNWYGLTGCGGKLQLLNSDHTVNSNANFVPWVNAGQNCNGVYGSFRVDQQWQFPGA